MGSRLSVNDYLLAERLARARTVEKYGEGGRRTKDQEYEAYLCYSNYRDGFVDGMKEAGKRKTTRTWKVLFLNSYGIIRDWVAVLLVVVIGLGIITALPWVLRLFVWSATLAGFTLVGR